MIVWLIVVYVVCLLACPYTGYLTALLAISSGQLPYHSCVSVAGVPGKRKTYARPLTDKQKQE